MTLHCGIETNKIMEAVAEHDFGFVLAQWSD